MSGEFCEIPSGGCSENQEILPNSTTSHFAIMLPADIPVHRILRESSIISQSQWTINFNGNLAAAWKAIPRICFVEGECPSRIDKRSFEPFNFCIGIKSGQFLINAGQWYRPDVVALSEHSLPVIFGPNSAHLLGQQPRGGFQLGLDDTHSLRLISPLSPPHEDSTDAVVNGINSYFEGGKFLSAVFPGRFSLKLRKLAMYTEGGHFDNHADMAPDSLGTLLIDVVRGGRITFNGADNSKVDEIVWGSKYSFKWCAFLNGVTHEVLEVQRPAGVHCAVLQFDIFPINHPEVFVPLASVDISDDIFQSIQPLVSDHNIAIPAPEACDVFVDLLQNHVPIKCGAVAVPLFHSYNHAYLKPEFLKAADRALFDTFLRAGYAVVLTPFIVIWGNNSGAFVSSNILGPCDAYDTRYTAGKAPADGVFRLVGINSFTSPNFVKYFFTKHAQSTQLSVQQSDQGIFVENVVSKYFSAAMLVSKVPVASVPPVIRNFVHLDTASYDVTLIGKDMKLPTHKELLTSRSEYFRGMFGK